jgi:hypothetical protein
LTLQPQRVERLRYLARVVGKECVHLSGTDQRLFADGFGLDGEPARTGSAGFPAGFAGRGLDAPGGRLAAQKPSDGSCCAAGRPATRASSDQPRRRRRGIEPRRRRAG